MLDIPGYEGKYCVSRQGEVFSLNYNHTGKIKKLKPRKNSRGYLYVNFSKNGKHKTFQVHRLVAMTYLKNYSEDLQVDHRDRNPSNNKLSNLRMVTHQQNKFNSNAAGCLWNKKRKKWQASICWNYKQIFLGYFDTEEEAYLHYLDAKEEILKLI